MTWTRISDNYFDREEVFSLSRSAALLNIEAMVWCNRLGTDGHVPVAMLTRLTTSTDPHGDAAELVAAHVWEVDGNGWQVDWTDQEIAAKVNARREAHAKSQQAFRDRKEAHARGDHSQCDVRFCRALQRVTGHVTDHVASHVTNLVTAPRPVPSLPVPSRPEGTGTGTGREAHAATASPQREPHQWQDDSSGISCDVCNLPKDHACHSFSNEHINNAHSGQR